MSEDCNCCGAISSISETTSLIINHGQVNHVEDQTAFDALILDPDLNEGEFIVMNYDDNDGSHDGIWVWDGEEAIFFTGGGGDCQCCEKYGFLKPNSTNNSWSYPATGPPTISQDPNVLNKAFFTIAAPITGKVLIPNFKGSDGNDLTDGDYSIRFKLSSPNLVNIDDVHLRFGDGASATYITINDNTPLDQDICATFTAHGGSETASTMVMDATSSGTPSGSITIYDFEVMDASCCDNSGSNTTDTTPTLQEVFDESLLQDGNWIQGESQGVRFRLGGGAQNYIYSISDLLRLGYINRYFEFNPATEHILVKSSGSAQLTFEGLVYDADFSNNFSGLSLVHKQWVLDTISSAGSANSFATGGSIAGTDIQITGNDGFTAFSIDISGLKKYTYITRGTTPGQPSLVELNNIAPKEGDKADVYSTVTNWFQKWEYISGAWALYVEFSLSGGSYDDTAIQAAVDALELLVDQDVTQGAAPILDATNFTNLPTGGDSFTTVIPGSIAHPWTLPSAPAPLNTDTITGEGWVRRDSVANQSFTEGATAFDIPLDKGFKLYFKQHLVKGDPEVVITTKNSMVIFEQEPKETNPPTFNGLDVRFYYAGNNIQMYEGGAIGSTKSITEYDEIMVQRIEGGSAHGMLEMYINGTFATRSTVSAPGAGSVSFLCTQSGFTDVRIEINN